MLKKCSNKIVSIIVPIYNVECYVEKCIDSILSQTYKNLEIILVNDGSTDGSRDIISKYLSDDRVRIIDKPNGGLSSARNVGINESSGDFIYFIDSDDYILPETISKLVDIMNKENADFCCFGIAFYDEKYTKYIDTNFDVLYLEGNDIIMKDALLGRRIKITAWSKFYNSLFIKNNNLYFQEGIINEDYLFTILSCSYAMKVAFLNKNLYMALVRPNSISRNIKIENITSYFVIDIILQEELFDKRHMYQFMCYYNASYIKNILYGLLQCVYKCSSYKQFKLIYKHLKCSDYYNKNRSKDIKLLGLKFYVLYILSLNRFLFFIIGKIIKKIGFYMP